MSSARRALSLACAVLATLAILAMGLARAAADSPTDGAWNFQALLDGSPIGEHRFVVSAHGDERQVESVAAFDVKLLGFTAYSYRHKATETWRGGCLVAMKATTDDDGKTSLVIAETKGDKLLVISPTGKQELSGCVMSFAYWNPALRKQSHLLNAQTGRYEPVKITVIGDDSIDVHGEGVTAQRLRISGPKEPIDLWYSPQGDWLGLDSTVTGGRKLSYRLK